MQTNERRNTSKRNILYIPSIFPIFIISQLSDAIDRFSKVHTFKTFKKTDANGMEKEDIVVNSNSENLVSPPLRDQLIYRPVNLKECSLPAVSASGEVVNLLPTITPPKKNSSFNIKFSKEPRFVPYEPYKAATSPILQVKNDRTKLVRLAKTVQPRVEDLVNMKKLSITKVDDLFDSNANQKSDKFVDYSKEEAEKNV